MGLVASIVVARLMGHTSYGELGVIQSTVGMFGVVAGFGLGVTATKFVAELRHTDPDQVGRIIGLSNITAWVVGAFTTICLIILAPYLAAHALAAPHLGHLLVISSVIILFSSVTGSQNGALAGFEAFKSLARINIVVGFANISFQVFGAYYWGVAGALVGMMGAQLINCVLNTWSLNEICVRNNISKKLSGNIVEWRVLLRFSLPCVLSGLFVAPVHWVCAAMLVNRTDGYSEMALFNAANQWLAIMLFLPNVLSQALLPVLSDAFARNDDSSSSMIMQFSMLVNCIISIPTLIIGCVLSSHLMNLYGDEFKQGGLTLCITLLTGGIVAVQGPVGQVLAASGKMWLGVMMNMVWGAVFLLISFSLIKEGALGLALARLFAYIFHAIWAFRSARKIINGRSATPG